MSTFICLFCKKSSTAKWSLFSSTITYYGQTQRTFLPKVLATITQNVTGREWNPRTRFGSSRKNSTKQLSYHPKPNPSSSPNSPNPNSNPPRPPKPLLIALLLKSQVPFFLPYPKASRLEHIVPYTHTIRGSPHR